MKPFVLVDQIREDVLAWFPTLRSEEAIRVIDWMEKTNEERRNYEPN